MKKVSVIMPSFLGKYPNSPSNVDKKIIRAMKSFLTQSYKNKELLLISDNCNLTESIYNKFFKKFPNIKYIKIPNKQVFYSGVIRNNGLKFASGDYICYLDVDDVWGKTHLETIMTQIDDEHELFYFNDYYVKSNDFKKLERRNVELREHSIGSSSIIHKKLDWLSWSDGIGNEWLFIMDAIINGIKFRKLENTPQYLIGHWDNKITNEKGDF